MYNTQKHRALYASHKLAVYDAWSQHYNCLNTDFREMLVAEVIHYSKIANITPQALYFPQLEPYFSDLYKHENLIAAKQAEALNILDIIETTDDINKEEKQEAKIIVEYLLQQLNELEEDFYTTIDNIFNQIEQTTTEENPEPEQNPISEPVDHWKSITFFLIGFIAYMLLEQLIYI